MVQPRLSQKLFTSTHLKSIDTVNQAEKKIDIGLLHQRHVVAARVQYDWYELTVHK